MVLTRLTKTKVLGSLTLVAVTTIVFFSYFSVQHSKLNSPLKTSTKKKIKTFTSLKDVDLKRAQNRKKVNPIPQEAESQLVTTQFEKAYKLTTQGKFDKAEQILNQIIEADPTNENALIELGIIHSTRHGDLIKGRKYFEEALRVNQNNEMTIEHLFKNYKENNDIADGIDFFESLLEESPDSTLLAYSLAQLQAEGGDKLATIKAYKRATKDPLLSSYMLADAAKVYSNFGETKLAIETFRIAIISLERQESDNSEATFGSRLNKKKQLGELELELIKILVEEGQYEEAKKRLSIVRSRLPESRYAELLENYLNQQT